MMGTQKDYYEVLGVAKEASADDIKKVYRKLVMQYHPDRVPEPEKKQAEEKFKEISEAYAVLSDPQKRQLYDQYGHAGIDSRYSTEDIFRGANFEDIFRGMGGFEDVFGDILSGFGFDVFGGNTRRAGRSARQRQGEDIKVELPITLGEAASGTKKEFSFRRYGLCSHCNGTGAEPGSSKQTCPTCSGRGMVSSGMGFINIAQTCPTCAGQGAVIKNRCTHCNGHGIVAEKKNITVDVPGGVDTDSVLRLKEEGSASQGGRGDLFLYINVRPHPVFERNGANVKCKVKVSLLTAILGGEIEVSTLTGKAKMKIPPGTQPNSVFRLRGKGIMDLHTKNVGDEFVEIEIEIPVKLSPKEKSLLKEWAKLRKEDI